MTIKQLSTVKTLHTLLGPKDIALGPNGGARVHIEAVHHAELILVHGVLVHEAPGQHFVERGRVHHRRDLKKKKQRGGPIIVVHSTNNKEHDNPLNLHLKPVKVIRDGVR